MKNKIAYAVIFTFLVAIYGYTLFNAFGNILGVWQIAKALGDGFSLAGIIWSVMQILMPVLILLLAILIGLKKSKAVKLLALGAGISLVALWQINFQHFISVTTLIA